MRDEQQAFENDEDAKGRVYATKSGNQDADKVRK